MKFDSSEKTRSEAINYNGLSLYILLGFQQHIKQY